MRRLTTLSAPARSLSLALPLALSLAVSLAGCVSLPTSGDVDTRPGQEPVEQRDATFDFSPTGPVEGSPPMEIVEDFLLAMQASPQSTAVARKFLTDEAATVWAPDEATWVYDSKLVSGARQSFEVSLEDTVRLDGRGTWLGSPEGGLVSYDLDLVRERGEWRISNPPDALVIPRSHFETRYRRYALYFFDPSARVLVPELTYLPEGDQAPTLLVRRLLLGPPAVPAVPPTGGAEGTPVAQDGVLRTFLPKGTENLLSVPVSPDGVAEVPLSVEMLQLDPERLDRALAQLAWTLGQVTGLDSVRVTVEGSPLELPDNASPQQVSSWSELDPAVSWTSEELFALREGDPVALSPQGEVAGRFGAQDYALRDIAVDLQAQRLAGVTEDGTTLVLAPRGERPEEEPEPEATSILHDEGVDLLQPAWDVFGDLWAVDRRYRGVRVLVRAGDHLTRVPAPGLNGTDLAAFAVSRDGSRLVAVQRDRTGDSLVVARVLRTEAGRVLRLTRPVVLAGTRRARGAILDVGWSGASSLVALTRPARGTTELVAVHVDGSSMADAGDVGAEPLRGAGVRLVVAPLPTSPVYVVDRAGRLLELGPDGEWAEVDLPDPLSAATYVG